MPKGKMDSLEIELASSILYYDSEELEKFIGIYDSICSDSNIVLDGIFDLFMSYIGKITIEDNLPPKERRQKIIDDINMRNSHNVNILMRDNFSIWFERVNEIEVPLELSDDILNHLLWESYKNTVDSLDKSDIPFQEKLTLRPKMPKNFDTDGDGLVYLDDIEIKDKNELSQYTTGLEELDKYIKLAKTNFIVIAARPGVGKSLFMLQMSIANAKNGVKSLFVSLEMGKEQINDRILNCYTGENIYLEHTDEDGILDFQGYKNAIENVRANKQYRQMSSNLQLYVSKASSADAILTKIEEQIDENGYEIIFIDYLQLLRFNRMDEWASLRALTKELKNLAFRKNVIVVTGSQVSRSSTEKGLYLSDLFGSSSIESDTDLVLGLENLRERRQGEKAPINVKILKQREGDLAELQYIVDYSTARLEYHQ